MKMDLLFRPDVIYFMIKYVYKSFYRYIHCLHSLARSSPHQELLFEMINILSNIDLALSNCLNHERFYYSDFLTQFRCRVLKEKSYMMLLGFASERDLDDYL